MMGFLGTEGKGQPVLLSTAIGACYASGPCSVSVVPLARVSRIIIQKGSLKLGHQSWKTTNVNQTSRQTLEITDTLKVLLYFLNTSTHFSIQFCMFDLISSPWSWMSVQLADRELQILHYGTKDLTQGIACYKRCKYSHHACVMVCNGTNSAQRVKLWHTWPLYLGMQPRERTEKHIPFPQCTAIKPCKPRSSIYLEEGFGSQGRKSAQVADPCDSPEMVAWDSATDLCQQDPSQKKKFPSSRYRRELVLYSE